MTGAAEWTWAGVAQAPGQLCSVQVHGARDGLTRGCGWVPRAGLAFAMEHHFIRVRGWWPAGLCLGMLIVCLWRETPVMLVNPGPVRALWKHGWVLSP